jgi:hypothetical protein
MRNTPDGDGTLLDHSLMMIGGGMSNGNIHSHMDVPIALVGGGIGMKGNRHVATQMGTPCPISCHLVSCSAADRQLRDSTGRVDSMDTRRLHAKSASA